MQLFPLICCTENFLKKQSFKFFNARSNLLQPRTTSGNYKTSTDTGSLWYQSAIASCSRSLTAPLSRNGHIRLIQQFFRRSFTV